MTNEGNQTKKNTWIYLIFLIIGFCCCLQFYIVGIIGVIRGYSIQSYLPGQIMIFGYVLLFFLGSIIFKKSIIWGFGIFTCIFSSLIMNEQSKFYDKGMNYYLQSQYGQALKEFSKETQTWYLRIEYNPNESLALDTMTKCYCQLGDFNKACETLNIIINRYPGVPSYFAKRDLNRIQNGLKKLNSIDASNLEKQDDINKLYELARTYHYELGYDEKAIGIYKKIVDMPVDDNLKEEARKAIQTLQENIPIIP